MISVIIPGYNVESCIAACLDALLDQTVSRESYKIIYVDDASTDGSRELVRRYPHVCLLALPENRGQATARNLGLDHARGEIILFTDADCVPAHDWIEAMLRPFQHPEIVGAKGVYRTRQAELVAQFAQIEYESRYEIMRRQRYIDFVDTYSAGYRAEVLRRYGGFDPSFRIDEDQELSFRMAEAGEKMVLNPDAMVYHRHPGTWRRYLKRKYDIGFWKAFVVGRHPQKAVHDSHTPQGLKVQLGLAALSVLGVIPALFEPTFWLIPALGLALLALLDLTLIRQAFARSPRLGLVAPLLIWGRALALGLGLAMGLIRVALGQTPPLPERPA